MPRSPQTKSPRKVWRISKQAPLGEWVHPNSPITESRSDPLPEVSTGNWVNSSFDLASGADVQEVSDTIPGELFEELFEPKLKGRRGIKS